MGQKSMTEYRENYYQSGDGLKLYSRLYGDDANKNVILCMHGLTRNSADFHNIALHLCERYRVISVDQRGRGKSQWDPESSRYNPVTYVSDMWALLDSLSIDAVALVGTSLGGLMSMIMGATVPARVKGIVLNDIGPVIERKGLERIKKYVGKASQFDSWQDLADTNKTLHELAFPDFTDDDWMRFAKRTGIEGGDGKINMNYDPAISKPIEEDAASAIPPDLWHIFAMLAGKEMLTVRGEISDILSQEVLTEMIEMHEGMETHIVPNEGHAPFMDDPDTLEAIDFWAKRVFD